MNTVLVIFILLLLAAIFFLLYRLTVLTGVFRGRSGFFRVDPLNSVNAWLFPLFMLVFFIGVVWSIDIAAEDFLPEPSTEEGKVIDGSLFTNLNLILIVFFAAHVPLFVFPFIYRHKKKRKALFYPMNLKMEIIWTAIPFIAYMGLFSAGYIAWKKIFSKPEDPVIVEITGEQFTWIARYPGKDNKLGKIDYSLIDALDHLGLDYSDTATFDDFVTGRVHIPVDRDILFKIRSKDVIHSVFIPHFRIKMDAVPGMPTQISFRPTKTTRQMRDAKGIPSFNYSIYCAELCGRLHYAMKIDVMVQEEEEFQNWYRAQGSWLARHEQYIERVPDKYKGQARRVISETAPAGPARDIDIFNGSGDDTLINEEFRHIKDE